MPTPRTEVAAAAIGDEIFVAGGFTADGSGSPVVEVYDTVKNEWSQGVALPAALHHTAMASVRGRLYVVGGYLPDGTSSDGLWSWAPREDRWRAEPEMPTPRGALAVVAVGDPQRIHVVGGATRFGGDGSAALTPAHEVYDPAQRRWTTAASFPSPRDHLAAAAIGDDAYVIGGRELSVARNQARLDIFDSSSGRWRRGPDMPTARGGLAAASAGGRLFVFGGEERPGTFEEAEVYEVSSDRWASLEPLPTPRHGLGATRIADRIYVVAGGPIPGLSVSGAMEFIQIGA